MTVYGLSCLSAAMFVLAVTPGPGVFFTVSSAISCGFRRTFFAIAGIVTGDLIFLLFAVYGLSFVAELFYSFFIIVKFIGALYIVWLGFKLLKLKPDVPGILSLPIKGKVSAFMSGFSITMGNPKVILFYLGFLPAFMNLDKLSFGDVLIIAGVVSFILGSVLMAYALCASSAGFFFKSINARKRLNRISGTIMITTGTLMMARG